MADEATAPKPKLSRRRKVIYFLAVYFILALLVELGLNIAKAIHDAQTYTAGSSDDAGSIVFICLGDSMTYGLGADREHSYPIQMPEFWKYRYPNIPIKVYNIGIAGYSTSNSMNRLARFFVETPDAKPDFALILLGINNRWNLQGATFWDWEKDAKKDNYAEYLASKLQLGKVFNMAAENEAALIEKARNTTGVKYNHMLYKQGWDMFFESFDDELLIRWIDRDMDRIVKMLREHDIQPVFLPYHFPVLPQLNDLIREIAQKHSALLLDIEKPAAYYESRKMFAVDDYHLNTEGYRDLAARVVQEFYDRYDTDALQAIIEKKKARADAVVAGANP